MVATTTTDNRHDGPESDAKPPHTAATTEYCAKLQQWMWQYYWGYANWQSWLALSAFPPPCTFSPPGTSAQTPGTPASTSGTGQQAFDTGHWYSYPYPLSFPASSPHPGGAQTEQSSAATATPATDARPAQQQNGNPAQAGMDQFEWIVACVCLQCCVGFTRVWCEAGLSTFPWGNKLICLTCCVLC